MPSGIEEHLSNVSQRVLDRYERYGSDPAKTLLSLLQRDMLQLQLDAIVNLMAQGIREFKSLSLRKLRAIQLALSMSSRKLPKTLELVKNRLESSLATLLGELPKHLH